VVVPGGGRWADAVRAAQKQEGFDDRVAHCKALGAMETFGRTMCEGRAAFVEASSEGAIHSALERGKVAVWTPTEMVLADASIPQTWDVTSDSLAAWLAGVLEADLLILLKSVTVTDPEMTASEMQERNWVDPCFDDFCSRGGFQYRVLGTGGQHLLTSMLASGGQCTLDLRHGGS
jgi:5-(aminomethyl)-3-furanmethanol phosphate kinase